MVNSGFEARDIVASSTCFPGGVKKQGYQLTTCPQRVPENGEEGDETLHRSRLSTRCLGI